ncbi:MAG: RNA helicase [Ignavibacteriae bacterium HGW-Ignavibacteriae-1]|jgi:ATP-dependent RNA helicase DeaD|nr:MAG: RNA helicase [Ignavibacteriae bacterium HGW-Ignavibacteriae-1]
MNTPLTFEELGLSDNILQSLHTKGFETPSPIQEQSIPIIMGGDYDLVGQAQTGTGKTAAFGLPILDLIEENARRVQAIVLAPTRELAMQISEELNSLKGSKRVVIAPIYGGQSIDRQIAKLTSGVDIIVGTPGRVIDLLNRKVIKLQQISYLVLDEADEMLNMGFVDDVELIMKTTNSEKRTFMFCATMPKEILGLAKKYMNEFKTIKIESNQLTTILTDQIYFEVEESDKLEALCRIIDFEMDFYGLIFCRTKLDVDRVSTRLNDRGYQAEAIHGDISQSQREKVLAQLKSKRVNILVATDVAARGIDVQNLTHVINYSLPQDPESYVHRVGRTGRAGNEGTAITFVTRREVRNLSFIQKHSKTDIRKGKLPGIAEIIEAKKDWIMTEIETKSAEKLEKIYKALANKILTTIDPETALATLLKYTFADDLDVTSYKEIRERESSKPSIKEQTRLFIAKGKKDGMSKRSIVNFIVEKAKTRETKISNVEVFDAYSFITVPFQEAEFILRTFKREKFGKKPMVVKAEDRDN